MHESQTSTPRRQTVHEALLATLAFSNPALAGAITFMFGSRHLLVYWLGTLAIADVVVLELYVAALAGRELVRRLRWLWPSFGAAALPYAAPAAAFLILPAALPLGFRVGAAVLQRYGIPWSPSGQGTTLAGYGFSWGPDLHSYRVAIGVGLTMTLLFVLQRMRGDERERARAAEVRVKHLETASLEARLASLTAEMSPHFLFNALNTVASLVHGDPQGAEDVVLQLSDLYRHLLRARGASTHDLRDELAICEAYLRLEKARFGARLSVEIDVDPVLRAGPLPVPVLLLQPFVENAVIHGISTRARGGRVSVRARRRASIMELCIEDDGIGLGHSPRRGAGRATANCRDRLRLTYGEAAHVDIAEAEGGGTRVVLVLPVSQPSIGKVA